MAVAGLLPAAEREVGLGAGRAGVDVDDPGLEVAHRPEGRVRVAGEDRRRQAVAGLVDRRDGAPGSRRPGRPTGPARRSPPGRSGPSADAAEDRRLEEVAVREVAVRGAPRRRSRARPRPARCRRSRDLLDRAGVDQRADVGRGSEPRPRRSARPRSRRSSSGSTTGCSTITRLRPCSAGRSSRTPTRGSRRSRGRGRRRP